MKTKEARFVSLVLLSDATQEELICETGASAEQVDQWKEAVLSFFGLDVNDKRNNWHCPICGYKGPFLSTKNNERLVSRFDTCPDCLSTSRHRLEHLVVIELKTRFDFSSMSTVHFAPEPALMENLQNSFARYETADICMDGVDHQVDIRKLPFPEEYVDCVFACHVLEHIKEDLVAIAELRRILTPEGFAVLPVPVVSEKTIDYPEPNPREWDHVRAPGRDYFDRYREFFASVEEFTSSAFPKEYQTHVWEDRTDWPTEEWPLRQPSQGEFHVDVVPVCYCRKQT